MAAVCGMVLVLQASAQNLKQTVITVVRIQGIARYSTGDNVWHPLVVGKILGPGAILQTAGNSLVDIVVGGDVPAMPQAAAQPDQISPAVDSPVRGYVSFTPSSQQNVIRMWSDCVLAVDKLTISNTGADTISDTELDLRAGRIFFNVKKLSASSQYLIKIPNGVAGIRGTYGFGDANGSWACGGGSVVLSVFVGGKPVTKVISAGLEFNPVSGELLPLSSASLNNLRTTDVATLTLYHDNSHYAPDDTSACRLSWNQGKH